MPSRELNSGLPYSKPTQYPELRRTLDVKVMYGLWKWRTGSLQEKEEEDDEVKKLREQVRLQNQERKFLLKKIHMMKVE